MRRVLLLSILFAVSLRPVAPEHAWRPASPPETSGLADSIVAAGDTIRFEPSLWRNDFPGAPDCDRSNDYHAAGSLTAGPGSEAGFARPIALWLVHGRSAFVWLPVGSHAEGPRRIVLGGLQAPEMAIGDSASLVVHFVDRAGQPHRLVAGTRVIRAQ